MDSENVERVCENPENPMIPKRRNLNDYKELIYMLSIAVAVLIFAVSASIIYLLIMLVAYLTGNPIN